MAKHLKRFLLSAVTLLISLNCYSQLTFGEGGLFIKAGTPLSVAGLTLNPSADMQLNNNSISTSNTPISFEDGNSITKVYELATPLVFSGTLQLKYNTNELNGNTGNQLHIIYKSEDNSNFFATSVSSNENQTIESLITTPTTFKLLSATNNTVTLPLTLIDFTVKEQNNSNNIVWITSNEVNVDYFEVYKSNDGVNFSLLKSIDSQQSLNNKTYSITDSSPFNGINYYKIIQYDNNGTPHQLGIRYINNKIDKNLVFGVYPNPGKAPIYLKTENYFGKHINLSLFNTSGKLIFTDIISTSSSATSHLLNINTALPAGIYILSIVDDNNIKHNLKLVIE